MSSGVGLNNGSPIKLERFITAQEKVYGDVLTELKNGRKQTHWMWFIFPQLDGLGFSPTAKFYAIRSLEEARQFLNHPLLGARLLECTALVLGWKDRTAAEIFPYPDDLKLRSCMTLFSTAANPGSAFELVLERFYEGKRDARTLELLGDSVSE
ncbi:MAG: DUF1810 domain-containing protein [Lysobacterales bacterium]